MLCICSDCVLGADVLQTKEPDKTFRLLREHVAAVRAAYGNLSNSCVRIIVERNLGFEAEHLYRECQSIDNSRFVCEPATTARIGVLTTQERKLGFVTYTNVLLRENRMFAHSEHWVDTQKNDTRKILMDQLSFFGFTFMRPENSFQKEKFAISGKSAGGKDDLCMALLIGIYFAIDDRFVLL